MARSEGEGGKKGEKGENNFQKIYYECVCQVYECRVEFGAKPETVQLRSLKADLEKSAVRITLEDLLLACQGTAESRHCLFTLICQGCIARLLTKDLSSLHLLPVHPFLLMPCAWAFIDVPP